VTWGSRSVRLYLLVDGWVVEPAELFEVDELAESERARFMTRTRFEESHSSVLAAQRSSCGDITCCEEDCSFTTKQHERSRRQEDIQTKGRMQMIRHDPVWTTVPCSSYIVVSIVDTTPESAYIIMITLI